MRPDLPTGTVTVLFTDVEGSTKLLEEIGDEAYDAALAEHRRIVRAACQAHDGVEVDTQGDAFFFAFPEPSGALAAAQQMTEGLGTGPIQVRVGLHTGEPRLSDEGYVGKEVHFAARVAATGHGGQIVLSQATARLVDGELTDLGEHRLKDIAEPVSIFQLGDGTFPPLKTISNTNLPRPASSFVGREQELEAVLALIEEGARLVTLTGPGGSGKTRLALEAASTLVPEYKAGLFWVGLAALRDPALVTETIVQTLGAKDGLAEHIGEREMLLLLDNLEQVVEAAPELSSLLQGCPNLTLLVTSRELLRVQGEVEYEVPPLQEAEAVSLFRERSQLEPSDEIAELCAHLDNLPLAVELAAARTKALSPKQILERLSQRLDLLKGGRDADPRQQTLRATIEWSYDLLSPEEQALFRRLSVFVGGCTLEAAETVCDADLDTLQSLVEKSLLRFTSLDTGSRYWMLETIREYADERLNGESESLRTRHGEFFAELSRSAVAEFRESPRAWGDRLEADRDNLRAAMSWSLAEKRTVHAHEVATAYGVLCSSRGPLNEGRSWLDVALRESTGVPTTLRQRALERAANLAIRHRDIDIARGLAEESLELARVTNDADAIGVALLQLGTNEHIAGNYGRAEALEREALGVFVASGNARQVRQTLGLLGSLLSENGKYSEAREVCEEALTRSRAAGDGRNAALAATNLGHVLAHEGKVEEALRLQREALLLAHELLDLQTVIGALLDIAALAVSRGDHESAGVLLTALAALTESIDFVLSPADSDFFEEILTEVHENLDRRVLDDAVDEGRGLSLDDLVAYAVEFVDSNV
jgi:predicted ATPase